MAGTFKFFADLHAEGRLRANDRNRLGPRALPLLSGDGLEHRFARALAQTQALAIKEVFESFEFFARVRKYVRAPELADLCCGHGMIGVLFALFERRVERVILVDRIEPPSHALVREAAIRCAPWVADKLEFRRGRLAYQSRQLSASTAIIGVHACGLRTDDCIATAIRLRAPVAVMPCCYPKARCPVETTMREALGTEMAFDVDRSYRLKSAGYRLRWDAVPEAITPMSRILVAWPESVPCAG